MILCIDEFGRSACSLALADGRPRSTADGMGKTRAGRHGAGCTSEDVERGKPVGEF